LACSKAVRPTCTKGLGTKLRERLKLKILKKFKQLLKKYEDKIEKVK
jgi:hypothetical protein